MIKRFTLGSFLRKRAFLKSALTLMIIFGSVAFATTRAFSENMLYGRVDDFLKSDEPSFPLLGEAQVEEKSDSGLPASIKGKWHGSVKVVACRATELCEKWNADYADNWNAVYKKDRVGSGKYEFGKQGKLIELVKGQCLYSVPLRDNKPTYKELVGNLLEPTPEQIAVLDQAIASIMLPLFVDSGSKKGVNEVLTSGIVTHSDSEVTTWKHPSPDVWEGDTVSTRTVNFPGGRPPEKMYTESVTRVTIKSDDEILFEPVHARFSGERAPLCYVVMAGSLFRGEGEKSPAAGDVDVRMVPARGGVMVVATGGVGAQEVSTLIRGAKLRKGVSN